MQVAIEKNSLLVDNMPFDADPEAVAVFVELERRRALAAEGKSLIMSEDEAFEALRAAGCHV